MKHYTRGQFTATFFPTDGIPAAAVTALLTQLKPGAVIDDAGVTALLTQLKPGAVIDDAGVDVNGPFAGTRRLIINYREPAAKEA